MTDKQIAIHSFLTAFAILIFGAAIAIYINYYKDSSTNSTKNALIKTFEKTFDVEVNHPVELVQNLEADTGNVGQCTYSFENQKGINVQLDRAWFEDADLREKELLIFHELLHCQGVFMHDNSLFPNGQAQSIMHHNLKYISPYYEKDREYYILEAKTKLEQFSGTTILIVHPDHK